ncbi:MAG: UDPGP type 1 family protein [Verrucomicrobiota bacterium]|nr:UDPGP type 1 family protein [Verrucomicrobiota bacterium]
MQIEKILKKYGQSHLLAFKDELSKDELAGLLEQLEAVEWEKLPDYIENYVYSQTEEKIPENLEAPLYYSTSPDTKEIETLFEEAQKIGSKLLKDGKIAALTVAGGQGTRLGYDGPKGTYPISPIKNKSLFQLFAEQLKGAASKYGHVIKWYIMTSPINHTQTLEYFEENSYFGIEKDDIFFFSQGTMPCIDLSGKLMLARKNKLSVSPDGHGGILKALNSSGALKQMKESGVEHLSYFQVDNPLVSVVDPLFLGMHSLTNSEMSSRGLAKTGPMEKLGNFCLIGDKIQIIEYSDFPEETATRKDKNGNLVFRMGSPAIHVLSRAFIEKLNKGEFKLPIHRADKKVPFINLKGDLITPNNPNAVKLETFIFDALPLSKNPLILEAKREKQFGPVKNKTGIDSSETCRELLIGKFADWLDDVGISVPRNSDGKTDCIIEISQEKYYDKEELIKDKDNLRTPQKGEEIYYGY